MNFSDVVVVVVVFGGKMVYFSFKQCYLIYHK